jgi:hypothetical protein
VGHASGGAEPPQAPPSPVAPVSASAEAEDEGLEALPGEGWPSDDFPWLMPAEPESEADAAASGGAASGWGEGFAQPTGDEAAEEDEEPFPWDRAPSAPAESGGFGWEGEPSIGYEESAPASSAAWELEPAPSEAAEEPAGLSYSWHEEAEEPEEAEVLPLAELEEAAADVAAAEPAAQRVEIPGREAEPTGWAWSDEGAGEELAEAGDRWEGGSEHVTVDEEAEVSSGWSWEPEEAEEAAPEGETVGHPGAEPVSMAMPEAPPVELEEEDEVPAWAEEAVVAERVGAPEVVTVDAEEELAATPAEVPAGALDDVAARLERIARALRSGKPDEALEQGDPLQLLITGYALGYAEAQKKR